uniref:Uncharacterized protein n=1 Tax=Panagrolaimus sp. JU765 TaxID=591449 RepID=A0AC34RSG7_9BILA
MALEVVGDSVALYFRCMRFATRQVRRHPEQLQMDDASKLYIANAGPILGGGFEEWITLNKSWPILKLPSF